MRDTGRKRVLCMTHLPPPVNGVTLMGDIVANSDALKKIFDIYVIPFKSSDSISDIGSFRFRKVMRAFFFGWRLLVGCILFRPDLVYFTLTPNGKAFYRDLVYVLIIKLARKRPVYHLHGKGVSEATRSLLAKRIYRWVFKNCSVILLSSLLYDDIAAIVGKDQCFFLPNGIPDSGYREQHNKNKSDVKPPHILFLSNLVQSKGPLVLLEALADIRRRGIPFRASFAGVWESAHFYKVFMDFVQDNNLRSTVSYVGPVYGEEKENLLKSADIFAFPTYNDAFPLVVLEAMSFGLPVVTTLEGAIPDMVLEGESGFLVPRHDPLLLADCLVKLINDPELRTSMGKTGRRRYEEAFTVSIFEKNLLHILKKVQDIEIMEHKPISGR